jgi:hypothetical protein
MPRQGCLSPNAMLAHPAPACLPGLLALPAGDELEGEDGFEADFIDDGTQAPPSTEGR